MARRVKLLDWLHVKASYEHATRLPGTDEIFGHGLLIAPNLALAPEVSQTVELGALMDRLGAAAVVLRGEVNGLLRLRDQSDGSVFGELVGDHIAHRP